MARRIIELPPPSGDDEFRMLEVVFYLLVNNLSKFKANLNTAILEAYADKINVSKTILVTSAIEIQEIRNIPIRKEIVITLAYLKVPIRTIQKYMKIAPRTYYDIVNEVINQGHAYLKPRLDRKRHIVIKEFLSNFKKMFIFPMEVLKNDRY